MTLRSFASDEGWGRGDFGPGEGPGAQPGVTFCPGRARVVGIGTFYIPQWLFVRDEGAGWAVRLRLTYIPTVEMYVKSAKAQLSDFSLC